MNTLLYYREAKDGQILEEGITEAGSMASFIAAGTAYATQGINTIPFFIYYSMFGFQRIADFIWAAADMRVRGFLLGGTAGRTTLSGEGLQHQDGNSHILALPVPNLKAYDPAYAYEIAVIIQDGIRRMYQGRRKLFLLHHGDERAVRDAADAWRRARRNFEAGCTNTALRRINESETARAVFRQRRDFERSAAGAGNSGREIQRGCGCVERDQLQRIVHGRQRDRALEPSASGREAARAVRHRVLDRCARRVGGGFGLFEDAAEHDLRSGCRDSMASLGTDGFGRSEGRTSLREFFEVDARFIVLATLNELFLDGKIEARVVDQAIKCLGIDADKLNPAIS